MQSSSASVPAPTNRLHPKLAAALAVSSVCCTFFSCRVASARSAPVEPSHARWKRTSASQSGSRSGSVWICSCGQMRVWVPGVYVFTHSQLFSSRRTAIVWTPLADSSCRSHPPRNPLAPVIIAFFILKFPYILEFVVPLAAPQGRHSGTHGTILRFCAWPVRCPTWAASQKRMRYGSGRAAKS